MSLSTEPSKPIVFVDSNAWIGYAYAGDALAHLAYPLVSRLTETATLVMLNLVVYEIVTVISQRVNRHEAVIIGDTLFELIEKKAVIAEPIDAIIEEAAWDLFTSSRTKNVSFTDYAIAAYVLDRGIETVVSFDKDVKRLGRRLGFKVIGA